MSINKIQMTSKTNREFSVAHKIFNINLADLSGLKWNIFIVIDLFIFVSVIINVTINYFLSFYSLGFWSSLFIWFTFVITNVISII